MNKLAVLLLMPFFAFGISNKMVLIDPAKAVYETVIQTVNDSSIDTYISEIKLIDNNERCELILNFNKTNGNCFAPGVNFCSFEMDGDTYTIKGLIGAFYSYIPTYIELDGYVYNAGCYIEGFGPKYLVMEHYSN